MAYIPKKACWYLADIVLELRIDGDARNVIHINTHLIRARSSKQAYEKALAIGHLSEQEYPNTEGRQVRILFRGLRQLTFVYDALEDGAELAFEEYFGVPDKRLQKWIRTKDELNVFCPDKSRRRAPNYMPESVMRMLEEKLRQGKGKG